jgi:hypothetical protein
MTSLLLKQLLHLYPAKFVNNCSFLTFDSTACFWHLLLMMLLLMPVQSLAQPDANIDSLK